MFCTVLYSTVQYCTVLYSTVQYCTVLYSIVQYLLFVMIKKIKNAPRSAGWAKRVFDFCSRMFTRCIKYQKKIKKAKLKQLEFQTIFEKVTLEPLIKSETFTNRSGLKNQYQRWVSCTLFVGRMTISLKNIDFQEKHDFPGCGFSKFSKI